MIIVSVKLVGLSRDDTLDDLGTLNNSSVQVTPQTNE